MPAYERLQRVSWSERANRVLARGSAKRKVHQARAQQVFHGGPRTGGTRAGAMEALGMSLPIAQCVQRNHSMRLMRPMNSWTDSMIAGSGVGAESAARACASFVALPAGASRP